MFFKYLPFNVSERVKVNEVMQELTKYLNVTITNQEMSQVKALKFDEKKTVEANIDYEKFQVILQLTTMALMHASIYRLIS